MEGLRKRVLGTALSYYREFIEQRPNDTEAQAELRDTSRRVETILADLAVLRAAGHLFLLIQPPALDDLRLDDRQRGRVADLSARAGRWWMETFGDPGRRPPPDRRVKMALEQARANEAEIQAILTPPKRLRLRQLALQAEGTGAFREPEVIEALGLTTDQRQRIRAIEEEIFSAQIREFQSGKVPEEPGKPSIGRIMAMLTPDQVRRWNEMAGEPARGPLNAFPLTFPTPRGPKRPPADPAGTPRSEKDRDTRNTRRRIASLQIELTRSRATMPVPAFGRWATDFGKN
jgi:hypothetical protein